MYVSAMATQPSMSGLAWFVMNINTSKLIWGITSVMFNLGSRFLITDITPAQQRILQHPVYKRIVVFCMMFAATRDVILAAILAGVIIVLLEGLLNESSRFCIIPGVRPSSHPASMTAPAVPSAIMRSVVQGVVSSSTVNPTNAMPARVRDNQPAQVSNNQQPVMVPLSSVSQRFAAGQQ
jgi:hypothetical protein